MADLSISLAGIRSPNPFWLASGPPTNSGYQIRRAFEAGWGGAVWKTLGEPVVNVSSRLGSLTHQGMRMFGLNNIELISDRPLADNLREMRAVKRDFPDRAVIASLMVQNTPDAWTEMAKKAQDAGADGLELNFGCPHGMSERGMGSAVGQSPVLLEQATSWVARVAEVPIIVKLTPNVADIRHTARAAVLGGANAVSMVNTVNSVIGVDLDTWSPLPDVDGRGTQGGYCGPAVKPIALHKVSECARDPQVGVPISGIGGISDWRDAVEFLLLGATGVQVCTAVMHHGFRIVGDLLDGLNAYLDERGIGSAREIVGRSVGKLADWGDLNLSYRVVARIDEQRCIRCNKCHIACEDAAHQCIDRVPDGRGGHALRVDEVECVGCNLCSLVCPVEGCIDMVRVDGGEVRSWREMSAGAAGF